MKNLELIFCCVYFKMREGEVKLRIGIDKLVFIVFIIL